MLLGDTLIAATGSNMNVQTAEADCGIAADIQWKHIGILYGCRVYYSSV